VKETLSGMVKALVAAVMAGLSALAQALPDGVTGGEWAIVGAAALTALVLTWSVTNGPARQTFALGQHEAPEYPDH
jgi:CHASE2 domain-containing sensor protein